MSGRATAVAAPHRAIIEALAAENHFYLHSTLENSRARRQALALSRGEQRTFVLAAAEWLDRNPSYFQSSWAVRSTMFRLLMRRLPFEHADLIQLLDWSIGQDDNCWRGIPEVLGAVAGYLAEHSMTPEIRSRLETFTQCLTSGYLTSGMRKWLVRLRELTGQATTSPPLITGEAWSDAAIADIQNMDRPLRSAWISLLNACQKASGPAPTKKWLKTTALLLDGIGFSEFKRAVLRWFPLVDKARTQPRPGSPPGQFNLDHLILDAHADILKALAWACSIREDSDVARALRALAVSAYRKAPAIGPRCVRVGNACVWALGHMPGREGIVQLALLKANVKLGTAQKGIEKALAAAAERAGLPMEDIEEMSAPAYGMHEVGIRREQMGEFTAELVVTGTKTIGVRWLSPDGKRRVSAPQAVKAEFADELKDITQAAKDIKKMLSAQRDRIDSLYLQQKKWGLPAWRERYLDHPLVGTLARRLIWKFSRGDKAASGIWREGRIVGRNGAALDWLDASTQVELWHPIQAPAEMVLEWREWLVQHQIQQPFKQAHREIYLLTDAERSTRVYSNRFAAHIIRQHQFNALCAARGWKNRLRLMVDDTYPPAMRWMPAWGLRAEFWVEGAGDNYGTDTNQTGTFWYLATDQVRFYPIGVREHYAHAWGGGYRADRAGLGTPREPVALENVPPLVFSEIMRDVDLFVGVASVGNDPNWSDGGPDGRYRDYWTDYSFGSLSESAKTRRAVLERLLPRLKIASRCTLTDRFLIVQGELRRYKIHLGSGNILMEPDDRYLCIVPSRGRAAEDLTGKVFLPFEGDRTLAIILSKTFLLAEDKKITDPTITRQIGR